MKQLLKNALSRLGYRIQRTRYVPRQLLDPSCLRAIQFDDIVCRLMFEVGPSLNFIQVGGFDGVRNDPLRRYIDKSNWHGIIIEPQALAVAKLRELYRGNKRIIVVQAALDQTTAKRTLYKVESENGPAWIGALASFDRKIILKHSDTVPGLEQMIKEEIVDCITFDDALGRLSQERIDILQVDAEGADAYILSLFPFNKLKPAIVHWEVQHLNMAQREDCLEKLRSFGYRFAPSGCCGEDMMALLL
jgi:FkbM family methyltransferase